MNSQKGTMTVPKFTRVEEAMMLVLSDGQPHTRQELHACLYDDRSPISAIKFHLSNIRKKLEEEGKFTIVCVLDYGIKYRYVQLVTHSEKELTKAVGSNS